MSDEKNLKQQLAEIEGAIVVLDQKIENHVENSGRLHEVMRADIGALDRRQERLEVKMDSFFESISDLRDELSRMNVNMATYNGQLAEHMRRTALSESRLEKMEDIARALSQKDINHETELARFKIISSTIVKVFMAIAGGIGLVWTVMQMLESLYK